MQFTRATYRRAIRRAKNEVYSRADVLEWAKDKRDKRDRLVDYEAINLVNEARTKYFKALDLFGAIKDRAKREGKLK